MIKIGSIFADNMLLQRQKPIRIWGTADRKQNFSVLLNGKEILNAEIADTFSITLPPQEAMEDAKMELIGGTDQLIISYVTIGSKNQIFGKEVPEWS